MVRHEGRWTTLAGLVPICPWGTLVDLTLKCATLVSSTVKADTRYPPAWRAVKWCVNLALRLCLSGLGF